VTRAAPGPEDVHVWWIDLAQMPNDVSSALSPEERDRANRFRRPIDRARWMSARAALRQVLAEYLGISPASVAFGRGSEGTACRAPTDANRDFASAVAPTRPSPIAMGEGLGVRAASAKPVLANDPRLRFNLAHAGDRAVLAVAWEREVGIDLEPIDAGLDLPPLLTAACTPAEIARVEALPPDQRIEVFLALWTVKEAYLKAIGVGVFREPRTLEVEFLDDGRSLGHDAHEGDDSTRWGVRRLDAGAGWVAALAVAGSAPTLIEFDWPRRG
jgi:4'-phosphopantetheinyl transferase